MFNSIIADLRCPVTGEIAEDSEIQIKWQAWEARALSVYRLGDTLEEIEEEWNNTWIRTDYICASCSRRSTGRFGEYIRTADQEWHNVFVRIEDGRVAEILSEEEFGSTGVSEYVEYD